jgi:hypothetical protein
MTSPLDDMVMVFLSCNHSAMVDKRLPIGYELQCRRCFRMSTVTETPNFVVKCKGGTGRSCPAGRSFGILKASAVQFAVRHRIKYPHHLTVIEDHGNVIERFGSADPPGQGTLFDTAPNSRPRVVYTRETGRIEEPPPF